MHDRTLLGLVAAALFVGCGSNSPSGAHDAGAKDIGSTDAGSDARAHADARGDSAQGPCPVSTTKYGPVEGTPSATACAYEGIPYAAPPTGMLRWKAPAPPTPWTAPPSSKLALGCPQPSSLLSTKSDDEDCLYLNVWTPQSRTSGGRPVMVFVHGGGFTTGSGSDAVYNGTNLAMTTGNLVVTLNYRLGPFGYLSLPQLRAEDAHGSAGDYGILDQQAAFRWVKDNIAAFGGDPSNVTIFGESAGGTSMFIHLASPLSQGLFSRVMIESGWAPYNSASLPQTYADASGALLAKALGCTEASTVLSCLRGKSESEVLAAVPDNTAGYTNANGANWFPALDGYVLPKEPIAAIASGSFHVVPTLIGNNANEGTLFVYMSASQPTDNASYLAFVENIYPGNGMTIVNEYPVTAYSGSYFNAAAAVLADSEFLCPARRVADAIAATAQPAFRYEFAHAVNIPVPGLGAFHASEVPFVFGNDFKGVVSIDLSPQELVLSKTMRGYWGSMAARADPNGGGRFAWPRYDVASRTEIVLDFKESTLENLEASQCQFWDKLGL